MSLTLLLVLFNSNVKSLNVCVDKSLFTDENFKALMDHIDKILLEVRSNPQIPKVIRLNFHDCVSGCNGCVEMSNKDNIGLQCILGNANRTFGKFRKQIFWGKYKFSRADIYALMGYRALYHSSNYPGLAMPTCNFRIGRKDCTAAQENKEIFAKALSGWSEISKFYNEVFKFNTQEIVAIMGAHTLGRQWKRNSGFVGPWVAAPSNIVFTNGYYQNLLDKDGQLDYRFYKNDNDKNNWRSAKDMCDGYPKPCVKKTR